MVKVPPRADRAYNTIATAVWPCSYGVRAPWRKRVNSTKFQAAIYTRPAPMLMFIQSTAGGCPARMP
jgi:hypothetical protein